jgi:ADP-ribosyl-[dinitrogen reductase] hydrolase
MKLFSFINKYKNQEEGSFDSQILGGIIGFCVGDALGVPFEFKLRNEVQDCPITMIGFGTHQQPPGSWSDDSSLSFCLIDNLISGYDVEKLKNSYCNWYYYGYWTHDGKLPFDIGNSTFKALSKIKTGISTGETGETGETSEESNGNGSLMRVLPLSFYLLQAEHPDKFSMVEEVSGITHAHIRSKIACSIYVEMAIQLLRQNSLEMAYENMKRVIIPYYEKKGLEVELEHFERILKGNIALLSQNEIKSSGYVIDSLEACLWSLLNSCNYTEAVWKAIHLGDDTDTIGALTGGLAGIHYGISSIPSKWCKKIARSKDIKQLSEQFSLSLQQNE